MKSSKQPGFWQTLPGVLTALAGVITAVAGLIVAFDQMRARSARELEAEQSPTVSRSAGADRFDRSYYSELRALADDLPQGPVDPPLEQIEAHSVKELAYSFRVPAGIRTLALRITRMEEAGDIPLHLK